MKLIQIRTCDGVCCVESPRFPNKDHSDCIYHNSGNTGPENSGCQLMVDPSKEPDESKKMADPMFENMSSEKMFQSTCVKWPQNTALKDRVLGKTGGCCWQWVEDKIRR